MAVDLTLLDLEASIDEQARQLANACVTIGFFRLPLDVIDRDIADATWDSASAFFALDEATKRLAKLLNTHPQLLGLG